ncbi:2-oxoglutarate dehydrogenase E1 component [Morganella morganii]|uniref:2-oxoglutarate dehydrogenase E1 component n=1 Tax=Morganella morganii TaxID=582 RepID=UPI000D1D65E7|nr:2-oxoglutarate dehydrogenase E1 component [Morganella morganii]HAE78905.1 2-oxoglutarate dehydrogenase E1 component [Morganella sp. (in: enterobacteria)]QXO43657.1 2-oxoglutarate dehydrogenase E1 component [Morganella morganii]QXO47247.1 2-oxoglutarate dehydrogenase E1 component [Morganella morganii]QXO51028.1 2-oxoglutarate dehydrogenase E1 component [Morganella morganii]QXO54893.1 2-oxoglutarate dehydrogenase E1 component [Morganella morganii]
MQNGALKDWLDSSFLAGENQAYIEDIYEDYLNDPASVDESWREIFDSLPKADITEQPHSQTRDYFRRLAKDSTRYHTSVSDPAMDSKQVKVLQLINAFRFRGHQNANLDPLGLWKQEPVPDLDPAFHNLTKADFDETFNVGSFAIGSETMQLSELFDALKRIYCGSIGAEYMHITNTEEKRWLQQRLESVDVSKLFSADEKRRFLADLTAAEGLERYLGAKFPGAKRFSLEGGDSLIPMLKDLIRHAGKQDTREVVLGMAHRGRLNVLVNLFGKKPADLFDEFAGKHKDHLGTGDVKYHQGFSSDFVTEGAQVHLALAFNPSHLEIVSPVVIGSVRARRDRLPENLSKMVLPITIHGDSAVTGQGIVQETLNMSQARGYEVGGTVRIVINNQIGFTTSNPKDTRSTEYCTDIMKMVQAPIFHVNADDPEAVAFVTRLALDFRNTFNRDVMIDLVCYRRHGHNEADEPSATQPMMYQKIKQHPTPRKIYGDKLIAEGVVAAGDVTEMVNMYRDAMDRGDCVVEEWREIGKAALTWEPYLNHNWNDSYANKVELKRLSDLARRISTVPEEVHMHPRVEKIYTDRAEMAEGNKLLDWGAAENLAYATLVDEGVPVRLSGEDAGRGTFFHRHAVIHNQSNGSCYVPLMNVHNAQGRFNVWDSVLSEEAVLAFEYGYATTDPRGLTIWEAQFGDFANVAQVVIDQFISSGEQKWGRMCGLVMLLPHGYEGQGPEHSSARLERYLQLCAEQNMQVCVPSTPAQVYHMLRRQALRGMRRPLIVMSPKSLLRHPLAVSSLEELADGRFEAVIDEADDLNPADVKRVVLCSGKVYYDLLEQRRKNNQTDVAIIRIEQLYPFPHEDIHAILAPFSHVKDFVWCQEEPLNQGAWYCCQHNFRDAVPAGASLRYAGRPASASPAVGYTSVHQQQQQELVNDALNVE